LVNVDNALLAAEAAVSLGFAPTQIAAGLHAAPSVPGRLEVVAAPGAGRTPEFTVLVDYAHTPAGLEVALGEARRLTAPGGRVVTVFGCGGNRDRDKRPLMGAVAARLADIAVLTSDNPRDEDPLGIIEQVAAGVSGSMVTSSGTPLVIEPDRRAAISLAVDATHPGDVLVIAGKGHEDYQEVSGERIPFDDRLVVREELTARIDGDPDQWVPTVAGRQG
jgi:UDP-N-acetylmuramoyl-L-alanyl-D-glutamate--2,6-diaminopimelate ligase